MVLRKTITLLNKTYHVQIGLDQGEEFALTPVEREAIRQNGEPVVDCGGAFTGPPAFTLPARELRFPSQFPVVQLFNTDDYANAEDRANVFKDAVSARIVTAVAAAKTYAGDKGDSAGTWVDTSV